MVPETTWGLSLSWTFEPMGKQGPLASPAAGADLASRATNYVYTLVTPLNLQLVTY